MADTDVLKEAAAAHEWLAAELDALLGSGVLLDPVALRRLRATVDAVLPAAEAYERHVAAEVVLVGAAA
jgi:hypothetical protein